MNSVLFVLFFVLFYTVPPYWLCINDLLVCAAQCLPNARTMASWWFIIALLMLGVGYPKSVNALTRTKNIYNHRLLFVCGDINPNPGPDVSEELSLLHRIRLVVPPVLFRTRVTTQLRILHGVNRNYPGLIDPHQCRSYKFYIMLIATNRLMNITELGIPEMNLWISGEIGFSLPQYGRDIRSSHSIASLQQVSGIFLKNHFYATFWKNIKG